MSVTGDRRPSLLVKEYAIARTKPEGQDVQGHQRRNEDADWDSIDRDVAVEVHASEIEVQLVTVDTRGAIALDQKNSVRERNGLTLNSISDVPFTKWLR